MKNKSSLWLLAAALFFACCIWFGFYIQRSSEINNALTLASSMSYTDVRITESQKLTNEAFQEVAKSNSALARILCEKTIGSERCDTINQDRSYHNE